MTIANHGRGRQPFGRPRKAAALAALAVTAAATGLVGCGDNDTAGATAHTSAHPIASTATGAPLEVGFINSNSGAFPEEVVAKAAQAAADHVNGNGGIDNHPITLDVCNTDGSPQASINCANKFIGDRVALVVNGDDVGINSAIPVLQKAGITMFGVTGGTVPTPQNVFLWPPTAAINRAAAYLLKKQDPKLKTIAYIIPNNPYINQSFQPLQAAAAAIGVDSVLITVSPTSPDFNTAIASAKSRHADAIYLVMAENQCTQAVRTIEQSGFDGTVSAGVCQQFVEDLGAQAKGVYTTQYLFPYNSLASITAPNKADVELYGRTMTEAGLGDDLNSFAPLGFSGIMTLANILKGVQGDLTPQAIAQALGSFRGTAFMGGPVDCAARTEASGGGCGAGMALVRANGDGTQTVVDGQFTTVPSS
ncbi:putative ABC transporter, substrate-binding protein [Nocardia nova SH22a]|uniref:Putative ABC transporter, substrate-binding protein n=1 Tax=Nocardia nova SH22a TaxID=1415166 RepID=W5TL05_9NOCA|nr:putative ABC transporter, substrate-binding protein [Nocardia nova SH22a]